jgi:hypothetical protein
MNPFRIHPVTTWEEASKKQPDCVTQFESMIILPLFRHKTVELCMESALPEGAGNNVPNVRRHLFIVRAKHNWKWIGVEISNPLLSVLVAAGLRNAIYPAYYWTKTTAYWRIHI